MGLIPQRIHTVAVDAERLEGGGESHSGTERLQDNRDGFITNSFSGIRIIHPRAVHFSSRSLADGNNFMRGNDPQAALSRQIILRDETPHGECTVVTVVRY